MPSQQPLLDALTCHVALLDAEGVIVTVNEAWRTVRQAPDLLAAQVGTNYLTVCTQARGGEEVARGLQRLLSGAEQQFSCEYSCPSPDAPRWFRVRARRLPSGAVVVHQDVTDRVLIETAEAALRESEQQLRTLTEAMPQLVWRADAQRRCVYVNQRWCEFTGLSFEQIRGEGWRQAYHPDSNLDHGAQGLPYQCENRLRRADGVYRWMLVRGVPIHDEHGVLVSWIGTCTDVEELKQAQDRSRLLAEATSDAVWDRSLTDGTLWCSEGYTKLFGYPAGNIAREDWEAALAPADRDRVLAGVEAVIRGPGETWRDEYRFVRQDGSLAYVADRGRVIRDESGQAVRVVGGMTDITERKQLEEQVLRAQRMESVGTLAGGIAHDLNNVLTPVMMSLELLRWEEKDPDRLEILNAIESSARRGADMVRQVLSFARGMEGRRVEVQLRHVLRDIEKLAQDTFLKQIQVSLHLRDDLRPVMGDPAHLHQAILNLCLNARDAMPEGGILTIEGGNAHVEEEPYVMISVQDSGVGIDADTLPRIFDPFFTGKEMGHGTGLGLSTTLAIVKGHGGFLRVESQPGQGSRFSLYLPAEPAAPEPGAPEGRPPTQGQGELILVVDDEAAIRKVTAHMLIAHGYQVLQAADGAEAVALYASRGRDVAAVVTDMMMPIMDGAATIEVLRRLNPEVRIVAVSGLVAPPPEQVRYFLAKPYSSETLLRTLQQALKD